MIPHATVTEHPCGIVARSDEGMVDLCAVCPPERQEAAGCGMGSRRGQS